MTIIPEIIDQHAEEAAFLWLLRDAAIGEPHYDLDDLAGLDDRVEAHIDGLRIAGDHGWRVCRDAMDLEEPGEIFAAGVLAFESRAPKRMDALLNAVRKDEDLQRALISALGWIDFNHMADAARTLATAQVPFLRRMGIAAYAVHRQDPGPLLGKLLRDDDPRVCARALKACSELGRRDLLSEVLDHLKDKSSSCRFYAAWSGALLGNTSSVDKLKVFVDPGLPYAGKACDMAVRRMALADAHEWLRHLGGRPGCARLAITGYGVLGDPVVVPWLIEMMQKPELARAAGESFSMITGVDLAYEDLEGEWPEGFVAGPTEDPEDENVDIDPDEDLPWPEPELVRQWWSENQRRFKNGKRYLVGKAITKENCMVVLRSGYQRQRAAAALESAIMSPGRPLFEIRARGDWQRRFLLV